MQVFFPCHAAEKVVAWSQFASHCVDVETINSAARVLNESWLVVKYFPVMTCTSLRLHDPHRSNHRSRSRNVLFIHSSPSTESRDKWLCRDLTRHIHNYGLRRMTASPSGGLHLRPQPRAQRHVHPYACAQRIKLLPGSGCELCCWWTDNLEAFHVRWVAPCSQIFHYSVLFSV